MSCPNARRILFVTLTNMGDGVLTTPVLDVLIGRFPGALIDVVAGPVAAPIFQNDPAVRQVFVYDKRGGLGAKMRFILRLCRERYDLAVDLRNSMIPYLCGARSVIGAMTRGAKRQIHMRDRHLAKLAAAGFDVSNARFRLVVSEEDERVVRERLAALSAPHGFAVINPSAKNHLKRWPIVKFARVAERLMRERQVALVFVGDRSDRVYADQVIGEMKEKSQVLSLAGETTIGQLAAVIRDAVLVITNDSAPLHVASAMNTPTIALFGPTDPARYGPLADVHQVIRAPADCAPCGSGDCHRRHECMSRISADEVYESARAMIERVRPFPRARARIRHPWQRILVIRLDRLGDLLLSTPFLTALRQAYPHSRISVMVSPYTAEVLQDSPLVDEIIIYDKDRSQRGVGGTIAFCAGLRRKRFDVSIALHPTVRSHLVPALAGIPVRIGYGVKMGYLLTRRLSPVKQRGEKHELDYVLDVARQIGIEPVSRTLTMPLHAQAAEAVDRLGAIVGIGPHTRFVVIHPWASCPSKRWPAERFALVADGLTERFGVTVVLVSDKQGAGYAYALENAMRHPCVNFAGELSVSELAVLLHRARLCISNDSGPVHLASAVGTPVIAIFGRKQAGLGPRRWGPVGPRDVVLQEDVGCTECLAHECRRSFACLTALEPERVLSAAARFLEPVPKPLSGSNNN